MPHPRTRVRHGERVREPGSLAFDCESLRVLTHANAAPESGVSVALSANLATKLIGNNETLLCV